MWEALRVSGVRGIERSLARGAYGLHAAVEDISGYEECQAGMVVLVVVPAEEFLQPGAAVKFAGEASGIVGLVLERLELGFAEGVVVGDAWAAEATRGAE